MCGIAGIFNAALDNQTDRALVDAIVEDQHSRGPDKRAVINISMQESAAIFGHNRLSIIDLSDNGNQPMWDTEGQFCLIFNGQIYNYLELRNELKQDYAFQSTSDTEVILAAFRKWGQASIHHFQGMFAFALLNKQTQELCLVRDRFGVKPLFYLVRANKIYFASSSNVLAKHFNLAPNLNYISRGLNFRYYEDHTDETAYLGLQALPAGHMLQASLKDRGLHIHMKPYYVLLERVELLKATLGTQSLDSLTQLVKAQLDDAIKIRLRSDVPVGIALSGGLDSSTIATTISNKLSCAFSFGEPENQQSEGPVIAALAEQIQLQTHFVMPKAGAFADHFFQVLKAQDAPFPTCSILAQYFVYQAAKARGIKVLLSGQGADESFLGYKKFQYYYLQELVSGKQYSSALQQLFGMSLMLSRELKNFKKFYPYLHRYLKKEGIGTNLTLTQQTEKTPQRKRQPLFNQQLQDVTQYSLPTLLRYEDRNSMANSIESRLPYVDYRLVELAIALPHTLKIKHGFGKWILRQIMAPNLPDAIRLARYKRGFDANDSEWIGNGLGQLFRHSLQDNLPRIKDYLPKDCHIHQLYSDERLQKTPNAFAEAVSLIWLGSKLA